MKILHTVEKYFPSMGGMQEVVRQISERLAFFGHDVTIATSKELRRLAKNINGVNIEEFNIKGNLVKGISGGKNNYVNFLLNSKFDIITNFAAQQWATDLTFQIIDKIKSKKVFVPTGFSGLYLNEYNQYFKNMKKWMQKYDMNVFLSEDYRDINFAKDNNISKIKIIPNGASEIEFKNIKNNDIRSKLRIKKDDFLILLVGSHTGFKGHNEAINIFKKSNIPNSILLIIGNYFYKGCIYNCKLNEMLFNINKNSKNKNKKIIVKSLNRQDTIKAYMEADLFLFPSNIECSPLVLFESMASKTPFLSSDVGNAREISKWSKGGFILPTIKDNAGFSKVIISDSVESLEYFYRNKNLRLEIAVNGYISWLKNFTWEKITKQYENLYLSLL